VSAAPPRWAVPAWRVAAVQAALVLGWVVYAAWLPALLARQGLPAAWVPGLLLADQVVLVAADALAGRLSDRLSARALARLLWGAALAAAGAFAALPLAAAGAPAPLWWALLAIWLLASSAVRAPVLALLATRARAGAGDGGLAVVVCAMALASALAPLIPRAWTGVDPLWPFALSAMVLLGAVAVVVSRPGAPAGAPPTPVAVAEAPGQPPGPGLPALAAALLCGSFAAQWWTVVAPARLDPPGGVFWGPAFWVGAALMLPLAARWAGAGPRRGAPPVLPAALGVAAALALLDALWPAVGTPTRALGGAAWALAMTALLRQGLAHPGGAGAAAGVLTGAQALAAATRLALGVTGLSAGLALQDVALVPAAAFTLAAALVLPRPAGARRPPGEPGAAR
jgi:MFS family permease